MKFDVYRDNGRHVGRTWIGWVSAENEIRAREMVGQRVKIECELLGIDPFPFDLEETDSEHSESDEYA